MAWPATPKHAHICASRRSECKPIGGNITYPSLWRLTQGTQQKLQIHGEGPGHDGRRWRPVKLQTFLRGNSPKFFTVSSQPALEVTTVAKRAEVPRTAPSPSRNPNVDFLETEMDWLLLHHFQNDTFHTLSLVAGRAQTAWRTQMLLDCAKHSFLRHAVLSITASHVAAESDDVLDTYARCASKYLDTAMERMSTASGVTALRTSSRS